MVDQDCSEVAFSPDEGRLFAAIQNLLSMPKGRVAVWLHLAQLPKVASQSHRSRVAHAIMDAAAQYNDGDVFLLRNGDLVLLCRVPSYSGVEPSAHPTALPHTFSRLLQPTTMEKTELTRIWWLEHDAAALLALVAPLVAAH